MITKRAKPTSESIDHLDRRVGQGSALIDPLLSMSKVIDITTFSKASIYRKVGDHSFPAPIKIGKSRVAWRASSIARWIEMQSAS